MIGVKVKGKSSKQFERVYIVKMECSLSPIKIKGIGRDTEFYFRNILSPRCKPVTKG